MYTGTLLKVARYLAISLGRPAIALQQRSRKARELPYWVGGW